jgi:hypothetical protein
MALWTDLIDPATLTGYVRASLAEYETNRGTLARWLPNRTVEDVVVRMVVGQTGFIEAARYRSYDAEIEIGKRQGGRRKTIDLPALGQNIPVGELEQLRLRGGNVSDQALLNTILNTAETVVKSVSEEVERQRGIVLATGRATIAQDNYVSDDDFGRSAAHQVTSPTLWADKTFSRLDYLQSLVDQYRTTTGVEPGSLVMSTRVVRAMAAGQEFQTQLINGAARTPSNDDMNSIITGHGLPPIYTYDRRVSYAGGQTPVLPNNVLLMLPAPVDTSDFLGTELGATFWGRTLTSTEAGWAIADEEQAGVVAGVWKNEKPPMTTEIIADAIALPVLANADLSLAATVLAA